MIDDPEIRTLNKTIIAWIAGALVMVAGFFVVQVFMYGVGAAMAEAPFNFVQMAVAGIVGIPMSIAVKDLPPPLRSLRQYIFHGILGSIQATLFNFEIRC